MNLKRDDEIDGTLFYLIRFTGKHQQQFLMINEIQQLICDFFFQPSRINRPRQRIQKSTKPIKSNELGLV